MGETKGKAVWKTSLGAECSGFLGLRSSYVSGFLDKVAHRHSVSYSVKDCILHILWTILQTFSPYTENLLGRIGVFLDIEGRDLTFFSVAKCPLILSLVIQFLCQALFLNWTQTLRNKTRNNAIKSHATKYISFCISFSWEILCEML